MKAHRIPMRGGEEYDMLTCWRHFLCHNRGRSKWAKRAYNRRQRRVLKCLDADGCYHSRRLGDSL